jgi:hypothetical protein
MVGSLAFGASGWHGGVQIGGGAYTMAVNGCELVVRRVLESRMAWGRGGGRCWW